MVIPEILSLRGMTVAGEFVQHFTNGSDSTLSHALKDVFCGGINTKSGGNSDVVVTHSPPTSVVSFSNPRPCVGKLVVAYRESAVYSTVQNLNQLYVLVFSVLPNIRHDITNPKGI